MRAAIVYKYVPEYRAAFFDLLRERAGREGIGIDLYAGDPEARDVRRGDAVELPWALHVKNRSLRLGPARALWQPVVRETRRYDVVVVEQAARLLFNYVAMLRSRLGGPRVIAWGHGRDLASSPGAPAERLKRATLGLPDHWFAYSEGTRRYLETAGIDSGRISVVHNSKSVECGEADRSDPRPSMVFVGSLEPHKRIDFLLEAASGVRERVPDAQLLVVGSGRLEAQVDAFCATNPWARRMPATHGPALGTVLRAADVVINPFGAGLAIVDSIQCGVPMVIVAGGGHGPEYEYVRAGVNAAVCEPGSGPERFAEAAAAVLTDPVRRDILVEGCRQTAPSCSLDRMVGDFIEGLRRASRA